MPHAMARVRDDQRRSSSGREERRAHETRDDAGAEQREQALVVVGDHGEHRATRLHDEPAEAEDRAEQDQQQRAVAEQRAEQLAEGQPLCARPRCRARGRRRTRAGRAPIPRIVDERDRPGPAVRRGLGSEAERVGEGRQPERRGPERDGPEGTHETDHPVAPARFGERRSDEPPERHVAERVREPPDDVDDREVEHRALGDREQQRREHGDGNGRIEHERPQFAPARAGHVDEAADDRVADRVDDACHGDDGGGDRDLRRPEVGVLQQEQQHERRHDRVDDVLPGSRADDRDGLRSRRRDAGAGTRGAWQGVAHRRASRWIVLISKGPNSSVVEVGGRRSVAPADRSRSRAACGSEVRSAGGRRAARGSRRAAAPRRLPFSAGLMVSTITAGFVVDATLSRRHAVGHQQRVVEPVALADHLRQVSGRERRESVA